MDVGASRKILVIDDDELLLQTFWHVLGGIYEVELANGGQAGLDTLARGARFGAIVCDLQMPGVNGIDVYHAIRRDYPNQAERLLFCTGSVLDGRLGEFVARTKVHVLHKPCTREEMLAALARVAG